jgi:hypothetical protein
MTPGQTPEEPAASMGSDRSEDLARFGYVVVAWAFLACLAVQLFLVGLDLFEVTGEDVGFHREFAYIYGWLAPAMVLLAVAGRLPQRTLLLTVALLVLFAVQTYLPSLAHELPDVAALHAVNAIAVVWISATLALSVPRRIRPGTEDGGP